MSDDLSQFHGVFFEEAREHLEAIENELLAMDLDNAEPESLNAIFRAAHSIKGSSGVFGFSQVADFTHHLETMLDLLRKGELAPAQEIVDLILESVDTIRAMTGALEAGEVPDVDTADLQARLAAQAREPAPSERDDSQDDDSFGLFSETEASAPDTEDDDFGLFEDVEDDGQDDDFGFFDDVPAVPGAEPVKPQQAAEDYFSEFFGEPAKSVEKPAATAPPVENSPPAEQTEIPASERVSEQERQQGYGLYQKPSSTSSSTKPSKPTASNKNGNGGANAANHGAQNRGGGESSIRVSVDKVDQLINLVGELVITQSMLIQTSQDLDPAEHESHLNTLNTLERHTRDLQDAVMSIRLLPVSFLFNRFPRVVRDLARNLGKDIDLQMLGQQTELDKTIIERLNDPMMHLVRNAIDHGIESPDEREAAGKPGTGQVILTAAHEGGNILIEISDDGRGMDRNKLLEKAASNGISVHDAMTDSEVWQLIFEPGFSTAAEVTDVSGRGVGMDVVKKNIQALGGKIDIESFPGEGSRFSVRLPLTLAILDGMTIAVHDEVLILPLASVVESFKIEDGLVRGLQGRQKVIPMRGEYIPLIDPAQELGLGKPMNEEEAIAVVLESEGRQVAIMVNDLLGQQQVVIKSIESNYRKVPGFSGATIMGDGSVALILDVGYLVNRPGH